jgi:hypothetical protein
VIVNQLELQKSGRCDKIKINGTAIKICIGGKNEKNWSDYLSFYRFSFWTNFGWLL